MTRYLFRRRLASLLAIEMLHKCVTMPFLDLCTIQSVAAKKITTLNLRIDPRLKEALRCASVLEHRSIANMVEVLILRHCEDAGITIPEQQNLFEEETSDE